MKAFALLSFLLIVRTLCAAPVDPPVNLNATPVSPTQINLEWQDVSNKESGFQIFQSRDNTNFINIATVDRNIQTYQAKGLINGTRYWFRVRAYKGGAASTFSNSASAMTLNPSPPSPSPSPTATPTPRPTPTPTLTPSPSPSPSASATPTPTPPPPTPTPTPTPTATPSPTPSPSVSPSPSPTPTATAGQTRTVVVQISNPTAGDAYQIYYGTTANNYGPPVAIITGSSSVSIPGLVVDTTYYFANKVTRNGVSSVMSSPVPYTVTSATTQTLTVP